MRKFLFLLCFFLLFCTAALWASEEVLSLIERSPYPSEDKAYLCERVPAVFADVQDISQKLLLKKLREGLAKKVPPEDLVRTLERRKETLQSAQNLLEETGIQGKESLLENLAVSLELAISPEVLREVLARVASNPKVAERFVDTVATFLEVGVPPEKTGEVLEQVAGRKLGVKEIRKVALLLEQARREGIEVQQIATALEKALEQHDNFALVEVELQNFIAANKPKPALRSGGGISVPQPGVSSGGTPVEEGGTPLESQPSAAHPPTQEGGAPLE